MWRVLKHIESIIKSGEYCFIVWRVLKFLERVFRLKGVGQRIGKREIYVRVV